MMPIFNKMMVKDITKSAKWYEQVLGFTSLFKFRNEVNEVMMDHLRLSKYQDIMLIQSTDFIVGNGLRLNLTINNMEEISSRLSVKDLVEPLTEQPWNAVEMTIKDCDGYLLTLTQPSNNPEAFDKVIQKTRQKLN